MGKEISTLDRGFPSVKLIQNFNNKGKYFVMRTSSSFLAEVNNFRKSSNTDEIIHVNYTKRRAALSKTSTDGIELPYSFDLRCVKILLSTGEVEILITNLPQDEFSTEDLGKIYNLRWQIEISFLHLKHAIRIEDFIGKKENSILQEFYATLIKANILMQLTSLSDAKISNSESSNSDKKKFNYKTNFRAAAKTLKETLYKLFFSNSIVEIIDQLVFKFTQRISVIKPDRSFSRKFNSSKHSVVYR